MKDEKQTFLETVHVLNESDALKNTIKATFGRNKVYRDQKPPFHERRKLHETIKGELENISIRYQQPINEEKHCKNIEQLAGTITKNFKQILRDGKFKIGAAQKALNLHLKFKWCLGKQKIPPPHCPLDSRILKQARIYDPWTKMDSIETYKSWIKSLREMTEKKSKLSLPEWELDYWNKAKTKNSKKRLTCSSPETDVAC